MTLDVCIHHPFPAVTCAWVLSIARAGQAESGDHPTSQVCSKVSSFCGVSATYLLLLLLLSLFVCSFSQPSSRLTCTSDCFNPILADQLAASYNFTSNNDAIAANAFVVQVLTTVASITADSALLGSADLNNVAAILSNVAAYVNNSPSVATLVAVASVISDLQDVSDVPISSTQPIIDLMLCTQASASSVANSQAAQPPTCHLEFAFNTSAPNINISSIADKIGRIYPSLNVSLRTATDVDDVTVIVAVLYGDCPCVTAVAPTVAGNISQLGQDMSIRFQLVSDVTVSQTEAPVQVNMRNIINLELSRLLTRPNMTIEINRPNLAIFASAQTCHASSLFVWPPLKAASNCSQNTTYCTTSNSIVSGDPARAPNITHVSFNLGATELGCNDSTDGNYKTVSVLYFSKSALYSNEPLITSGLVYLASSAVLDVNIVDGGVYAGQPQQLQTPFQFSMQRSPVTHAEPLCVYYDTSSLTWQDHGCGVIKYDNHTVYCRCSRLASFAVLVSTGAESSTVSHTNTQALGFISFIGFSISMFCLIIHLYCFIKFTVFFVHFCCNR